MSYKWRVVAMLWCISFFNYADRQAIFSVFPLLEREMHLTPVQLGLLGSGLRVGLRARRAVCRHAWWIASAARR